MKVLQVLGTRPNLVKFINITGKDIVVWTGQHYSLEMINTVMIPALGKLPSANAPDTTLGYLIVDLSNKVKELEPDLVLVYGDTRSALAGALAADQLNIPLAHIEAGCRLGDMCRPEERIRKMIDSISDYLFCVNEMHRLNLIKENVAGQISVVGDVHYDRYLETRKHCNYSLATIHRAEHTDSEGALREALSKLKRKEKVVFPVHPRTRLAMDRFGLKPPKNVKVVEPMRYVDFQIALRQAKLVITDSGGVCREAWFSGTPVEFIGKSEWEDELRMFGDGTAGEKIRNILKSEFN